MSGNFNQINLSKINIKLQSLIPVLRKIIPNEQINTYGKHFGFPLTHFPTLLASNPLVTYCTVHLVRWQ